MRYPEKRRYGRLYWGTWYVSLGTITSFDESLNRQVSTVSVPSRSSEYTIGLDGGGRTDIELSLVHLDGQDGLSNAAWASRLRLAVDRWQARTDGVVLRIGQVDDREDGSQVQIPVVQTSGEATDGNILYSRYDPYFQFESEYQGYIASLTINLPTSMTDVLQGSLRMTLGSRTIRSKRLKPLRDGVAEASQSYDVNDTAVRISFDKGATWQMLSCPYGTLSAVESNRPLRQVDPDPEAVWDSDNDTMIKSYSVTGGFMCPFEQLDITLDTKAFRNRFIELYPDDGAYGAEMDSGDTGPKPRETRVRISGIGGGEYMIAEIRATSSRIRMIGYSTAYLAVMTPVSMAGRMSADSPVEDTVVSLVGMIRDGGDDAPRLFPDERIHVYSRSNPVADGAVLDVTQGMTVWSALQTLAQACGARVFFAQGHAYFVDYNMLYHLDDDHNFVGSGGPVTLFGHSELFDESGTVFSRPLPLDLDDDLADRRTDTASFERSESDILNNLKVKYTLRSKEEDKQEVKTTDLIQSAASVNRFGLCPLSTPVWDLSRVLTTETENDAVRVGRAALQGRSELYTVVSFTLKDALNPGDGSIIWSPYFPPCSAVTALGSSSEQEYIYPSLVKE